MGKFKEKSLESEMKEENNKKELLSEIEEGILIARRYKSIQAIKRLSNIFDKLKKDELTVEEAGQELLAM